MEFNDILKLAKTVAKATPSAPVAYSFEDKTYSYGDMNEALRVEFQALAPDYRTYKINQNTIFSLIEQTIDEVFPQRVLEQYSQFAEIKTFAQGQKPIFTQKITTASRRRAKTFIGKVGLAGLYEVFKLDGRSYEVTTNAIGGAAQIGFEEFLDGRVNFADVLDIVMEGLDECIYVEIEKQLIGAVANVQAGNKAVETSFVESSMDKLIAVADSYGKSTIYCTYEFAATMIPSEARMSNAQKDALWDNGYIGNYKGHQVVVLPQSFEDETNTKKVIDPSYAWIIPVGAEKPVKIAFEGGTIVDEYTNYDRSKEIQIYKKVGVRAIFSNAICVYQNTSLTM
jgi:hypothetical protein